MTMLIPLLLYIVFQRYIINTFAMSGIRGLTGKWRIL